MASADATTLNGSSDANAPGMQPSAAQRLMQKHEDHKPTIEDVPDEEDLTPHPHPVSTSILESTDEATDAPGWPAAMSAKAAGKRKEEPSPGKGKSPALDMKSDESFPGLGGAPVPVRTAPSAWVSKNGPQATNGARNGTPTNGTSTPVSATNTPPPATSQRASKATGPQAGSDPYAKSYTFDPKELPRSATKKPLPDLLRDISKKYRLNFTQTTGAGGAIKITGSGRNSSESAINQAFKELGSHINKVCTINLAKILSNNSTDIRQSRNSSIRKSSAHWQRRLPYQVFAGAVGCSYPNAQVGRYTRCSRR